MPLVQAKCPNCGGALTVDSAKEAALCSFCGTPFIVEKAIHQYNITNNNQINADVVNIYQGNKDFEIRAGVLEKYSGESVDVVIPESVTVIAPQVFADCKCLKSVKLPSGITEIGKEAFINCINLESIVLPVGVTVIQSKTFENCSSLHSVVLSSGLKKIDSYAFFNCASLAKIKIPDSVTEIGEYAFSKCSGLCDVILSKNVSVIEKGVFSDCASLESIIIPEKVSKIDVLAFIGCKKLSSVNRIVNGYTSFVGTPIHWKHIGNCSYCGGEFKGILSKVCKKCGKPKNY